MNQYFRLTGNCEKIAKVLMKHGIDFAFNAHPKGIEFILNIYDPTYEELVKEIGVKNVSVHSNFRTDKTTLYSLYRS